MVTPDSTSSVIDHKQLNIILFGYCQYVSNITIIINIYERYDNIILLQLINN